MIHTGFKRGTKVLIILTNGDQFVAKYRDTKSGTLIFSDHEDVQTSSLRSATIYRHQPDSGRVVQTITVERKKKGK